MLAVDEDMPQVGPSSGNPEISGIPGILSHFSRFPGFEARDFREFPGSWVFSHPEFPGYTEIGNKEGPSHKQIGIFAYSGDTGKSKKYPAQK